MVLFFQYVNLQYLELFKISNFEGLSGEELDKSIQKNIDSYRSINLIGIIFSATLVGSQFFKILFNIFGETFIPSDKWTIMEFLSAVINIITFTIISNLTTEDIKNTSMKGNYDILVIFVVVFTWFRFFSFFLVIKGVSRHFITIYRMMKQTIAFMIILACYLMFQAATFMLLFREYDANMYGNLAISLRQMYDFMNGNYNRNTDFAREQDQHIFLSIFHLFIAKILLINYIIALLMTVYNAMKEKGDFAYKSNRYEYIERYQIALKDGWGYSELVTTPAPLSISLIPILFFVFDKPSFKKAADTMGKIFFW